MYSTSFTTKSSNIAILSLNNVQYGVCHNVSKCCNIEFVVCIHVCVHISSQIDSPYNVNDTKSVYQILLPNVAKHHLSMYGTSFTTMSSNVARLSLMCVYQILLPNVSMYCTYLLAFSCKLLQTSSAFLRASNMVLVPYTLTTPFSKSRNVVLPNLYILKMDALDVLDVREADAVVYKKREKQMVDTDSRILIV